MSETIPYVELGIPDGPEMDAIRTAVDRVLRSGQFILGEEVERFEDEFRQVAGTKFAIGIDNGTSALSLALKAHGVRPGDEVITVPNSFLASASCIALIGAKPVFVDVGDDYLMDPNLIEAAVTPRTRAILPVHLTGAPADMDAINAIAAKHGLAVVEDAAQAVGARYANRQVGSLGSSAAFSFHPLKNLAAAGDAGMVTTNDESVASYVRQARNHGLRNRNQCDYWSGNCRLDALQAAILGARLPYLPASNEARRHHAAAYARDLAGVVAVPRVDNPGSHAVFHTFVIQAERRDDLQKFLASREIGTAIHYPIPIHLQAAAADLGHRQGAFPVTERQADRILSLPISPRLRPDQRDRVIAAVHSFYNDTP